MRFVTLTLATLFSLLTQLASAEPPEQSLHLDWLDKNINPATNFFSYANGTWQKTHPIPAAYPSWNNFSVLHEQNQQLIKTILEAAEQMPHLQPGSIEQKVGDFYFSGMDEASVNKLGTQPLTPEFNQINNIKNLTDLQQVMTHLQLIGVDTLFDFDQMQDFKNSHTVIGVASQSGLGLPDRDYYLKADKKFQHIRELYQQHIANLFVLLGDKPTQAADEAKTVMAIETKLALASLSRVAMRDPHNVYHLMSLSAIQNITPHFSWQNYLIQVKHPEITAFNLAMPDFFKAMDNELQTVSLADWKTFLRWKLIGSFAPFLSKPFVDENFHMVQALTGTKEILPRWKRVVNIEESALGFAIGKIYVEKYFPDSSKQQVIDMVNNIRAALKNDLQQLAWMTPATRAAAIQKLDLMEARVGYPDKWRDYSALQIDRGPYVLNVMRANEFLQQRELNKIGKPVDETEWDMTPQTINAYYDPSMNRLNIPAGILQAPFFDPNAPAAVNYGAIGFVIGHEMTHGFDDEGAQFDGHGNLDNWWSKKDLEKFHRATASIAQQYSHYTVSGGLHVQGKLVLGEATADFGGLTLAYNAFHHADIYVKAKTIDGFTPDQQFFLSAAHVWAGNTRPEEQRQLVEVDPHPPEICRVNGTLADMPQFQKAFKVAGNSPMVNKNRKVIW